MKVVRKGGHWKMGFGGAMNRVVHYRVQGSELRVYHPVYLTKKYVEHHSYHLHL